MPTDSLILRQLGGELERHRDKRMSTHVYDSTTKPNEVVASLHNRMPVIRRPTIAGLAMSLTCRTHSVVSGPRDGDLLGEHAGQHAEERRCVSS